MWLRAFVTDVEQMYPTVQFLLVPLKKLCLYQIFVCGKRGFSRIRNIPRARHRAARRNADCVHFFRTILSDNHSITINAFVPNAPSLNPLRTSESLTVFWCFRGVEKGCIGNKWVNTILYIRIMLFLLFYLLPLMLLLLKLQHRFKLLLTIKETHSTHLISLNLKKAPLV